VDLEVLIEGDLEQPLPALEQRMDQFLAAVERRALVTAMLVTQGRDEALDIVQEAMLAFVRAYAHKPQAEWPPLFHRVLQNKIRDWQRRQGLLRRRFFWSRDEEEGDDPLEALPGPENRGPEALVAQGEAASQLLVGLSALPERQRQAVLLRIWEGLDVAQTASLMGCSEGSVKTHLFRALQALRARLEGHWR
jgi:RNA polymerase sigma-70 factor, ECF subfamily